MAIESQNGTVEAEGNMLANSWYVYQQYVSSDCDKVNLRLAANEGIDTTVLCTDTGETVDGSAQLKEGENHFQILTSLPGEGETPAYQLSYRLNILRRGEGYYQEPCRGQYHYSVKEGWANDPNGLVKLGDTYHMFYQFYPENTDWGAMHWAHATSKDLIHWEEQGIKLYPNEYGTMFSGCAVADEDNVSGLFDSAGGIIAYAIAYSAVMNADYNLGDVVLETEDYTVYEAVKLQGEPARCVEYIVDILPLLQRERPNLFDGSDLEPDGYYGEQWQLALPLE